MNIINLDDEVDELEQDIQIVRPAGEAPKEQGWFGDQRPEVAAKAKKYQEEYAAKEDLYSDIAPEEQSWSATVMQKDMAARGIAPDKKDAVEVRRPGLQAIASDVYAPAAKVAGGAAYLGGEALEGMGFDEVGADVKEWGDNLQAKGQGWQDYAATQGDSLSPAIGIAGMVAAPLSGKMRYAVPAAGAQGTAFTAGEGRDVEHSLKGGLVDAGAVAVVGKVIKSLTGGSVTADDLAKDGIKALDKRWVLTDKRDLVKRIEATTGKSADEALKDVGTYMKTLDTTSLSEDQVVRMVVQNMTGGADFSPRAGKYLGKTESLDSATAPKLMQEAQARTDDIRSTVNNPQINEMIDGFTTKHGNFEATDWEGLHQALKDMGLPEDGPMMQRVASYTKMDDVTLLRQMQGANPVSNQRLSNVGQRGDWGAQAEAEYMDKIRQFVYSHIPGVNKDEKIVKSITKSLKKGNLNPSTLRKVMVESGVNPTGLTDEALQEVIDAGPVPDVGSGRPMPRNNFGDATRPEDAAPLIDEAELDARLGRNRPGDFEGQARAEQEASVEGIVNEFSTYGDELDDALQSGMDLNLQGNALRKHVRDTLVGDDATAQSSNTVGGAVFGSTAGLEQNDDGSITWDPVKGFAGAAVGGTLANKGGRKLLAEGAVKGVDAANEALGMPNMRPGMMQEESFSKAQMDAFWGGTETADPFFDVLGKFKDADPKMLDAAVETAKDLKGQGQDIDVEQFVGDFLRARDARYKNPELTQKGIKEVNDSLERYTNNFDANPLAVPATHRLEADMVKGQVDQIAMYEGAEQMYVPRNPNKVEEPGWSQDPKAIENIELYVADENDAVYQATRGGDSNLLDAVTKYPENFDGTTYRGSRLKGEQKQMFDNLKPGDIITNSGHLSTSTNSKTGASFADEPKYLDYNKKMGKSESELRHPFMITTKSKGHDIAPHSDVEEDEVILKANKWFRVVDKRDGSINHLLLEELPESAINEMKAGGTVPNADILKLIVTTGAVGSAANQIQDTEGK